MSAIIFADIVGFAKIMQQNESQALTLKKHFEDTAVPTVERFRGRVVKYLGDAILAEFPSAVNAVKCAIKILGVVRLLESEPYSRIEPRLKLRVGIHLGDIVWQGDDVHGDAVNIASRVQSIADNNTLVITRQVYDQVKNLINVDYESLGVRELKHITEPPELFLVNPGKIGIEKTIRKPGRRRGVYWGLGITAAVVIALAAAVLNTKTVRNKADAVEFRNNRLIALHRHKELWRFKMDYTPEDSITLRSLIVDLDDDGQEEVLASVCSNHQTRENQKLLCFDTRGRMLWSFPYGRVLNYVPPPYDNTTGVYSNTFTAGAIFADDLLGDEQKEIILVVNHSPQSPSLLYLLTGGGMKLSEYVNFGYFSRFCRADLDDDGNMELIGGGYNNNFWSPFLAVFDPRLLNGQSPPGYDSLNGVVRDYPLQGATPGAEVAYILLPRIPLFIGKGATIADIRILNDGNVSLELNYDLTLDEVYPYFIILDRTLRLKDIFLGDAAIHIRERLLSAGASEEELQLTKPYYWTGNGFSDQFLVNKNYTKARTHSQ